MNQNLCCLLDARVKCNECGQIWCMSCWLQPKSHANTLTNKLTECPAIGNAIMWTNNGMYELEKVTWWRKIKKYLRLKFLTHV